MVQMIKNKNNNNYVKKNNNNYVNDSVFSVCQIQSDKERVYLWYIQCLGIPSVIFGLNSIIQEVNFGFFTGYL
jgi:hypothetical protein